jgi:hypothetical protein
MNVETIKIIPEKFFGIGEVAEFEFSLFSSTEYAYCYKVVGDGGNVHYEVFERKNTPICLDFENRIYSESEFKETYPKSNAFGSWAWTFVNPELAMSALVKIFPKPKL